MRSPAQRPVLALVLAAACGPASSLSTTLSGGGSTSPDSTTSSSSTTDGLTTTTADTVASDAVDSDTTTSASSSGADSSATRMDLPPPDQGSVDPAPPWCISHKVDFIFFIQSYPEMAPFQSSIIESLPGIAGAIESLFADVDYHVMVVDGYKWGSPKSCGPLECEGGQGCAAINEPLYPCWAAPGDACDNNIGAGEVFPAGRGASNKPCGVPDGRRYLEVGDPDFAETLACIGQVGYSGEVTDGNELMEAVSPGLTGPNGCNAGFLRDDALLFMVLIGDAGYYQFNPYAWANYVKNVKGDDPDSIVVLGFAEWSDDFIGEFVHHRISAIDSPSYAHEFMKTAKSALELCDRAPR